MEKTELKPKVGSGHLLNFKTAVLTILFAVFVFNFIFPSPFLNSAVNYLTIIAVLTSLPFTGRGSGAICLGLFIAGAYLIFNSGAGWNSLAEAMGKNSSLLALLMAVPLLGVPLKYGGYIEVLDALASKYMCTRSRMYWVPALFSHLLGVFMNLGAVPLTYEITARGKMIDYPGVMARAISRGFGAALLWSPNMIATALVLNYLKVPWQHYVYLGISFAGLALMIGYAVDFLGREARGEEAGRSSGEGDQPYIDRVKLVHMAGAAVIFLLIVILIETKTSLPVISALPVIALAFPALWLWLLGRKESILGGYKDYFRNKVSKYDSEVVLFVAAGFFSSALSFSGWSSKICAYIMHFSAHSKASVALTILVTIILASLVGIHPMVLVSAFAATLDAAALGFTPAKLALLLISGWALGATVSPMSGTSLVVGSLTGKTPFEVAFANYLYSTLVLSAVILYVSIK